jgi:cytochrome oxidase assembly protein ShyY1
MKVVVAVAASAAFFLTMVVATWQVGSDGAQAQGTKLSTPAEGQARPELLDDGSPVFVVAHRDGSVSVLSAINPHLDWLVVWFARSRVFRT